MPVRSMRKKVLLHKNNIGGVVLYSREVVSVPVRGQHGHGEPMSDYLPSNGDDLIPDPVVAKEFGVCLRTLKRWDSAPNLNFAPAVKIRSRTYRRRRDVDEFKRRAAVAFAANRGTADADQAA
jgi:hypothetical protein